MKKTLVIYLLFLSACSGGSGIGTETDISLPDTPFTIKDNSQFIGGPLAQGRLGDILLANDKIKVIIQQPSKLAQSCPFGGVIIDADIVRPEGEPGQDNFGKHCPLVNIEWTVNYRDFQVISDGANNTPKIVRATGIIDVLDYLDLDFIAPVAKALTGQSMYFSPRFSDKNDPFATYHDLGAVNTAVVTDYTLEPGKNYVKIDTTFQNDGDEDVVMPVGQFLNGSGQVQTLLPGMGFTPQPTAQITGDTVAVIYVPFQGVDVTYGYFYDVNQFASDSPDALDAQKMLVGKGGAGGSDVKKERLRSASLTYSGVTGVFFGEEFLNVLPLGGPGDLRINFKIPPHGARTVTQYLVVGDGDPAAVFGTGLSAMKVLAHKISGKVFDSKGNVAPDATLVVQNETNMTVITYRTDKDGNFSGYLSAGTDSFAKAFGTGKYKIFVDKPGYHKDGTNVAGTCDPLEVNVSMTDRTDIKCTLGPSGNIVLTDGVRDADSGKKIPARLTIVGFDPSPDSHAGAAYATTHGAGNFEDTWIFERPWGVVDVKYVDLKGDFGLDGDNEFNLEPGRYYFVFSKGVEYSMDTREVIVSGSSSVKIDNVKLKRVIKTPGWISSDFHLHCIVSPDSAIPCEKRVLAAAGEGMDVLQSSDHDWLTDYAPMVAKFEAGGVIPPDSVATIVGQEISPNHYGHIHVFPLLYDDAKLDGGALDWTFSSLDRMDPSPDYVMSPRDVLDYYKSGNAGEGEKILQVNHVADQATSLLIVSSWVTTTMYDGVKALSSYVEPSAQRISPSQSTSEIPMPFGTNDLVIADFTTVELTIGPELYTNALRETGLPQFFNLLNLGIFATATADSDSHREVVDQMGTPRNYIASPVDPKDGFGTFASFDKEAFAKAINDHRLIATTGPFVEVSAKGDDGVKKGIGDVVKGPKVKVRVDVKSPAWAWFDTIEIYANTEPLPADDDGVSVFRGVASDPKAFFAPYHIPKFYYEPSYIFTTSDGSLSHWSNKNGVITASLDLDMDVKEDTWIVVFVSGNQGTEGWRSLFPFVTKSVADPSKMAKPAEDWTLDKLASDKNMKTSAWAFANPIFIDVDGDTNGDGDPFEAIYIKNGLSPLAK
ncbi:MAG: hypothetical protein COV46_04060 [Deltaproteobacteria bacterium CG11_big_fil_rev_8_21_14_0_20_49_13]|nr:MAG: hypothetical protein COV46_04060 [Deltaproteobacteria bacterium CG11_big_fil_rev_8_21_14_0_20_49_13]